MKTFWKDITEKEKLDLAGPDRETSRSDWIAILPLGATEHHGPHLPPETDSLIAAGIVNRLAVNIGEKQKVTYLPVEEIGYSPEHLDYQPTQSLTFDNAIQRWIEIGQELNRIGIRKMIILNAHGGNSPLMTIVATELRVRYSMLAVATSWTRFGTPPDLIDDEELAYGIHGGDIETSVMMALHPDKIRLENLKKFPSFQAELQNKFTFLRAYGKHAFGWKIQDLNKEGVVGDALNASAEKGHALIDHAVDGLSQLIDEVRNFDLSHLDDADKLNQRK